MTKFIRQLFGIALVIGIAIGSTQAYADIPKTDEVPYIADKLTSYDKKQIKCIADATYYEAGNQSVAGRKAVVNVILNRTKDTKKFASTPCGVIKQKTKDR
jgi:spore germination cell wall hydrolase CwlJ-like protein